MPFEEVIVVGCHSMTQMQIFNPLNVELNPICLLLALLGAHHILHISRIRVKVPTADSIIIITGADMFKTSRSYLKILSARR